MRAVHYRAIAARRMRLARLTSGTEDFCMNIRKFNRRADSVRWAYGLLERATTTLRAQRAAALIGGLEHWLDRNTPAGLAGVTTYSDRE
jgi:hypothetical protein